jgi:hypothetical protein
VLHSLDHRIHSVTLRPINSPTESAESPYRTNYDSTYEQYQWFFARLRSWVKSGQQDFIVAISFSANLRDDMRGFYKSQYTYDKCRMARAKWTEEKEIVSNLSMCANFSTVKMVLRNTLLQRISNQLMQERHLLLLMK